MIPKKSWIILLVLWFFLSPGRAHAGLKNWTLVGVSWYVAPSSPLTAINPNNGAASIIGPTGFNYLNSLARDKAGYLYSVCVNQLIRINPATGAGTVVATLNFNLNPPQDLDIRGLAFSPGGVLFAIQSKYDPAVWRLRYFLYRVNVATGVGTLVGSTGLEALLSLTFSSGGTLYGWDGTAGLVTINTATGVATDVNPNQGGTFDIQGIVFGPDGILYGVCKKLYRIDTATGAWTLVGGSYNDIRGLEVTFKSPELPAVFLNLLED